MATELYNRAKLPRHGAKFEVTGWDNERAYELVWELDLLIRRLPLKGAWIEIKDKWISLLAPRRIPKPILRKACAIYYEIEQRMWPQLSAEEPASSWIN